MPISRLTGDVSSIENFVLSGVADALSYLLRMVFFAGALFYLQWDLALVSLVRRAVLLGDSRDGSHGSSGTHRARSGAVAARSARSPRKPPATPTLVQAYNRQDAEVERFHLENLGASPPTMAVDAAEGAVHPAGRPDRAAPAR